MNGQGCGPNLRFRPRCANPNDVHHPVDDSSVNAEAKRRLTTELADFLERWRQALARQAPPNDPAVIALQQHAVALQALATNTGFGEITHCLARCHHAVLTRSFADLTHSLNALTALQHQIRPDQGQAAQSGERFRPSGSPPVPEGLTPPPMLTVLPNQPVAFYHPGAPHQVVAPPHVAMAQPPAVVQADSMETLLSARDGQGHARPHAPPPLASVPAPAVLQLHSHPPPAAPLGLAARGAKEAPGLARPPLINSAPAQAAPQQEHEQEPPPPSKPMLQVRNMFALRAFGRDKQPSEPAGSRGAPNAPQLLGLKSRKGAAPKSVLPPPQLLPNDPMGLPRLAADAAREPARAPQRDTPPPQVQQLMDRAAKDNRRRRSETPRPRPRLSAHARQSSGSGSGWILLGAGTLGAGVLVLAGVLVFGRRDPALPPNTQTTAVPTDSVPTPADELPRSKLSETNEQLKSLVVQMHGRKLTPELRAYVDEDAALVAKALSKDCKSPNAPEVCAELTQTFVDKKPLLIKKRVRDPNRPRAGWMRGLKMPSIPVDDDPRVERQFSFYTQNPVGRETFQAMLFRCGAYRDLIHATLVKYELPTDVLAVVLAESSCFAQAKSPAGAVGLWQFIPAAARAYHLRVSEGVVDERLSPFKSTQAGVRYMADMWELFGEWDLVFASYNMGPFGVMARLERAGGDVTYWDLVDADLLPEETENYAPAIQALALIMNNLSRLRFSTSQVKPPQLTADLEAPAGTRLGMVARAAAMSAVDLRKLNLDIMGENVPQLPGGFSVQVPKDVVWQARDTLKELLAQGDDADLCVSPAFDWGSRQFTTEMAEACHRKLSAGGGGPVVQSPAPLSLPDAPGPGLAPNPAPSPRPRANPPANPPRAPAAPPEEAPLYPIEDDPPAPQPAQPPSE